MNNALIKFYEYEIKNYPGYRLKTDSKDNWLSEITTNFNKIDDANNCGIIEIKPLDNEKNEYNQFFKSSCDVINSLPFNNSDDEYKNITNDKFKKYEDVYYKIKAKSQKQLDTYYNENTYNDILNNIKQICSNMMEYIYRNSHFDNDNITISDALVFNVKLINYDKVIVIGDLHGSFHTFWRHIKRFIKMGIMDNDLLLLGGYRIIFLGDIMDRGEHALEIIEIILNMMLINNTNTLNVIFSRGNHESPEQWSRYMFKNEMQHKFNNETIIKKFQDEFIMLMTYFPTAVTLEYPNNDRFWLCHGGFPILKDYDVVKLDFKKDNDILLFKNIPEIGLHNFSIPFQIKWNDFYGAQKTMNSNYRGLIVGTEDVMKFCLKNNIKQIIRGHQDQPYNSYILSSRLPDTLNEKFNDVWDKDTYFFRYRFVVGRVYNDMIQDNNNLSINKNYVDNNRKAVDGPIAKYKIDGSHKKKIIIDNHEIRLYPVITLSTNTDIDRPLNYDSFAMISYENYREKYLKYKLKYKELC